MNLYADVGGVADFAATYENLREGEVREGSASYPVTCSKFDRGISMLFGTTKVAQVANGVLLSTTTTCTNE